MEAISLADHRQLSRWIRLFSWQFPCLAFAWLEHLLSFTHSCHFWWPWPGIVGHLSNGKVKLYITRKCKFFVRPSLSSVWILNAYQTAFHELDLHNRSEFTQFRIHRFLFCFNYEIFLENHWSEICQTLHSSRPSCFILSCQFWWS